MQLEVVHKGLGGDIGVYGLSMTEIIDPCVLDGVDDEGLADSFGGLVHIVIFPQ